ncbi:MAG: efflux RND transporter periplasmic adaptor subunit [Rhodanobacteraceae bacterium]
MKPVRFAGVALVALALLLGACSSGGAGAAATSAAPQSQWLAVARGKVDVEGGLVLVAARADGVVESVAVKQGDEVKAGQLLAKLDPRAAKIVVATAKAGLDQGKAQLDELQIQLKQARQRAPRIAEAAKAGAATGESADQARDAVASLQAKQAAAQAALDAARQELAAAQLKLDGTTLRAPVAGTIVARNIAVGQTVGVGAAQPLFEVLPDRPHVVRAQVDADAAGAIHPGMQAEVVRDSGTGPTYEAKVLWVGQVLQSASMIQDPLARAIANDVDCTLQLEPVKAGESPLRIGQRVLVRFPRRSKALDTDKSG